MYSIVDSHFWIHLILSSSSREAGARFWHYNSRTHPITKKAYQKLQVGTYSRGCTQKIIYIRYVLRYCIVHLTDGTCCHGKPECFCIYTQVPTFYSSLERSDRAESGISRTYEKKYFLVKLRRKEKIGF